VNSGRAGRQDETRVNSLWANQFWADGLAGTYTVKLTVGGRAYSRPLIVKPDPR
jgi:hypothetical protein